jgi:hypothetical protein
MKARKMQANERRIGLSFRYDWRKDSRAVSGAESKNAERRAEREKNCELSVDSTAG